MRLNWVQPIRKKVLIFSLTCLIKDLPRERTAGYLNWTKDSYFIPMLDYDSIDVNRLNLELDVLQDEFHLSTFYLFHAKDHEDGYHAVSLDKMVFRDCLEVIRRSSCDNAFKNGAFLNPSRAWTLRLLAKGNRLPVEYYGKLSSKYDERPQSGAHAELLLNWNVPLDPSIHRDTNTLSDLFIESYKTGHNLERGDKR